MRSGPLGDIFREVDEELKQERLEKLWKQYGKYVIAAAVLVVVAVAGWKFWQSYQTSQRHAEAGRFRAAAALLEQGKTDEAARAFSALGAETSSGYGILARFRLAAMRAGTEDAAGAIDIYDAIAADSAVPASMRSLATVLGGLQALRVPSIDTAAIESRIEPLIRPGSAYRHVALEILAVTAHRAGDIEKAKSRYRAIVDDAAAPPGIRSRASQMLGILGAA